MTSTTDRKPDPKNPEPGAGITATHGELGTGNGKQVWSHYLKDWVTIDQNTRDPGSPDHGVNCGPACTCAMGRWMTGEHFDPERIRLNAGDPTGQETGTGAEIDEYFFGENGPVRAPLLILQPANQGELANHLRIALHHGHPSKILQVYNAPDSEWHWRVIHASWQSSAARWYALGDPWTGLTVVQNQAQLWNMFRGLLIIPQRSRRVGGQSNGAAGTPTKRKSMASPENPRDFQATLPLFDV